MKRIITDILMPAIVFVGIGAIPVFLVFMMVMQSDIRAICANAKIQYGESCVPSLMKLVEDESAPYRQRNKAIWALGQLREQKALPVLEELYSGEIPEKESLDGGISQYELEKAIRWINDGNVTSWMYTGIK